MNQPECDNVSVFLFFFVASCSVSCVSVGEHSIVFECVCVCVCESVGVCVSKHKLWAANGACSCCCVSHFSFQSTASYVAYGCINGLKLVGNCVFFPLHHAVGGSSLLLCTRITLSCAGICFHLPVPVLQADSLFASSQGIASWSVNRTKCLNNTVCQKTTSSAAATASLR